MRTPDPSWIRFRAGPTKTHRTRIYLGYRYQDFGDLQALPPWGGHPNAAESAPTSEKWTVVAQRFVGSDSSPWTGQAPPTGHRRRDRDTPRVWTTTGQSGKRIDHSWTVWSDPSQTEQGFSPQREPLSRGARAFCCPSARRAREPHFRGPHLKGPHLKGPHFKGPHFKGPRSKGQNFPTGSRVPARSPSSTPRAAHQGPAAPRDHRNRGRLCEGPAACDRFPPSTRARRPGPSRPRFHLHQDHRT